MAINVTVFRMPAGVKHIALHDGATVNDALNQANITIHANEQIIVDGNRATSGTVLANQARIGTARGC